jgi:DNA modification methylase
VNVLDQAHGKDWTLYNGDSAEVLPALPAASVDLSVYSPPFASLYVYSPSERDLGNSSDRAQFWTHYGFIIREMLRLTKPGRLTAVHVSNLATTLATHGVIGVEDFRGDTIRAYEAAGWIFHGESAIQKNPQAAAIRTHAKGLLFAQLQKDSSWMRPTLLDFILLFRKPGANAVPVKPDVSNEEWIEWAHGVWLGIRESDTLNAAEGRDADDERHICALQLGAIERCIRLWSNPGEVVLTPFAGIGSEVYQAVKLGRRGVGVELKPRYFQAAVRNARRAEAAANAPDLFAASGIAV